MPIVEVEGQEIEFPDNMGQDEIKAVLQKKFAPQPTLKASPIASASLGLADTASFGFDDELRGLGRAIGNKIRGNPMTVSQGIDSMRAERDAAQTQNPGAYLGGQVSGALLPAIAAPGAALSNVFRGGGLLKSAVQGAALSGLSSGAYGVGSDDGTMGDRLASGATYGAGGAAIGAAIPFAGAGIKAAIHPFKTTVGATQLLNDLTDSIAGGISRKLNRANLPKGLEKLSDAEVLFVKTLGEEGIGIDDALRSLQSAKSMGASPSVSVTANIPQMQTQGYLTSRGSAGSRVAADAIKNIDEVQIPELNKKIIEKATGGKNLGAEEYGNIVSQEAKKLMNDKFARLKARAAPFYEKAFNGPAVIDSHVATLVEQPEMKAGIARGLKIQRIEAAAKGEKFDPMSYGIMNFNEAGDPIISGVPNMRLLDAGKRGLDAMIEENKNQFGKPNEMARALMQLKTSLLERLDDVNPDYRIARKLYSEDAGAVKALKDSPIGKMSEFADGNLSKIANDLMTKDPQYIQKFSAKLGNNQKMRDSIAGAFLKRKLEESSNAGRRFGDDVFRSEGTSQRLKAIVGEERFNQMAKIDGIIGDLLKTRNIPSQSITAAAQSVKEGVSIPTDKMGVIDMVRKKIAPNIFDMVQKDPAQAARYNELLFTDKGYELLESISKGDKVLLSDMEKVGKFINGTQKTSKKAMTK